MMLSRRNRFLRRLSDRRCPPRTVNWCPWPTRLRRRAPRDAIRCPALPARHPSAVSSRWYAQPHPIWDRCTAGGCCVATTSLCAWDTARRPPLWCHSWRYRSVDVHYIIVYNIFVNI